MRDARLVPTARDQAGARPPRRRRLPLVVVCLAVGLLLGMLGREAAFAFVAGRQPTLLSSHTIFGDARGVGASLMLPDIQEPESRTILLTSAPATLNGLPPDAVIERAYVFWTGSLAEDGITGPNAPDQQITFTTADGASASINADVGGCTTAVHPILGTSFPPFYYCRADVTAQVRAHPVGGAYNGVYRVGDVEASPAVYGIVNGERRCLTAHCQAKYAAWSMVVVYSAPSATVQRDIRLYDGFLIVDHQDGPQGSEGVATFTIGGFLADDNPQARLSFFAVEGDDRLGLPPQNLLPPSDPLYCDTCEDSLAFNGTKLRDNVGNVDNLFNESLDSGGNSGVDIDSIDVSSLVPPRSTSATIRISSGSGPVITTSPPPLNGGGELFGYGWTLLSLSRPAPNFRTSQTLKTVTPTTVGQGESVAYTVTVTNAGSATADNTVVTDTLPAGAQYQAGSLQVGGVPCTDAADGDACTVSGDTITVRLGSVSYLPPQNSRQISFLARVRPTASDGEVHCNTARITSDQTPTVHSTAPACFTVISPRLQTPTKTDRDLDGGVPEPGDVIQYDVRVRKESSGQASAIRFVDNMPRYLRLLSVVPPTGAVDNSVLTGGANGTGLVDVSDILIPANLDFVTVTIVAQVDTVAQLVAAGVSENSIDGLEICNQGQVSAPFLSAPLSTDDPAGAGGSDPTCFDLVYRPNFATSTKGVVDVNGGRLEPGDTLRYTITLNNSGNRNGTIALRDELPPFVEGFTLVSGGAGAIFSPPPAGTNNTGRLDLANLTVATGDSHTLIFEVRVAATAPDASRIENCASINVTEPPNEQRTLCAPALSVFARPELQESSKSVVDVNGGDVIPGDTLSYTLSVRNSGNRAATNVLIRDVVDGNLDTIAPLDGGVYDATTRTITWSAASLAAGATLTRRFTARVVTPLGNGTRVCNQATVGADELTSIEPTDDPSTATDNDPTCVDVRSAPDFSAAQKSVVDLNGAPLRPGDTLSYTLTFRNDGNEIATNVVVSDRIDTNLINVAPLDGGAYDGASRTIRWNLGAVAPGVTRSVRFSAQVQSPLANGTVIANQGFLTADQVAGPGTPTDDPATATVDDPTRVSVTSAPRLDGSTKTVLDDNGGDAQPGDLLRYTITLRNSGDANARQTSVTDVVAAQLTNVSPLDGGSYNSATRTISWPAADLLVGVDRVLRFSARLAAPLVNGTRVCNQAEAQSADLAIPALTDDPSTAAAADPTCVTVISRPDLSASTKVAIDENGGDLRPGERVRFVITLVNQGTESAIAPMVSDVVSSLLVDVQALDGGNFDPTSRTISWALPDLAAGATRQVSFTARVLSPLDDNTTISNQAQVAAQGLAPVPTDDPATPAVDDPTVIVVRSAVSFGSSTKTVTDVNGGLLAPGDEALFTLRIRNDGTSAADNVVVRDTLDARVDFVSVTAGGRYDAATRTVSWDASTTPALLRMLPGPGQEADLQLRVRLRSPLADGTVICNQGLVQSDELGTPQRTDDPATPALGDPSCRTVSSAPDLSSSTKTVVDENGGDVRPGDVLRYTITLTNTGQDTARDLVVRDVIRPELEDVQPGQGGRYDGISRTVSWTSATTPQLAALDPGESVTLELRVRVVSPLDDGTSIANQALISGSNLPQAVPTDDPSTAAVDDPTVVTVRARVDLSGATKTVEDLDGGQVQPGDTLRYTIRLRNDGDALARDVEISDVIETNLTDVRPQNGGNYNAATRTITWALGDLSPADGEVVLRFTARIVTPLGDGTLISNQAQISASGVPLALTDDPSTRADDDPTRIRVFSQPDLSTMTKTVSGARPGRLVSPGDELLYTIELANTGTADAVNVLVIDRVDEALDNISVLDGGSYDAGRREVTWTLARLEVGRRVSLRFRARVKEDARDGARIDNQAFAERAGVRGSREPSDDPTTGALDDPTSVRVEANVDLEQFTKSVRDENGGVVEPGDRLAYTLVVRNSGTGYAIDAEVVDSLPPYLVEAAPGQGGLLESNRRRIRWTAATTPALARIAPGAEVTLSFTARVTSPLADGTVVENQAILRVPGQVDEPSDDPTTTDNDDPTRVTVVSRPSFVGSQKAVRDLNGGQVQPGDRLEYTIRVINTGKEQATGTRLFDAIPAHTDYVPGSTRRNGQMVADGGQSPLAGGLEISSPGAPRGVVNPGEENAATVVFTVQVQQGVAKGTIIANQGLVAAANASLTPTDDPRTAAVGDPTEVVVGGGPSLSTLTKTYDPQPVGDDGDGRFEVGEEIAYTVTVANTGSAPATNLVFFDPIDTQRARYSAGSLQLDGRALTDAADGDAGSVANNRIRVTIGSLAAGEARVLRYRVRIVAGPLVVNQGTLISRELPPELTDADGNDGNGDSPTTVAVGESVRRVRAVKTVQDLDGGLVDPGDTLLYTITLHNDGSQDENVDVVDHLPANTSYVDRSVVLPPGTQYTQEPPPGGENSRGKLAMSQLRVPAGGSATILFSARIDGDAEQGSSICNTVLYSGDAGLDLRRSEPACVLLGSAVGAGGLGGVLYRDLGDDNKRLDDDDQRLAGFTIQAMRFGDSNAAPLASAVSDTDGRYRLVGLDPGPHALRVLAPSGAQMRQIATVEVPAGRLGERDVSVDPSGIVYNAVSGDALAGGRVSLYYDEEDELAAGQKVPAALLAQGQQDQITDASGFYRFDAPVGRRYRIAVTPTSSTLQFPSSLIPATTGFARDLGPDNEVVPHDTPDPKRQGNKLTYYLRFQITGPSDAVFNNHIPLDPLSALIKLKKRADRSRASLGEPITYTITVENRSTRDFLAPDRYVNIEDVLPRGLRFLYGTTRRIRRPRSGQACIAPEVAARDVDGTNVCLDRSRPRAEAGRLIRFGPFPLGAGEMIRLSYQVAVGLDTRQGVYRNLAVLKDRNAASELSNRDEARVIVVPDPDLDQGLLLGKVFCDQNADGRQQHNERGVPGARIYLDNGTYAVTDLYGKYHLRQIDPGMRLLKLDVDSLRPGSTLTTSQSRVIHFTRGLPARVNFGVRCREQWIGVQRLTKAKKKVDKKRTQKKAPEAVVPTLSLAGDARALALTANGREVKMARVGLAIASPSGAKKTSKGLRLPAPQKGRLPLLFELSVEHRFARGWRLDVWRRLDHGGREQIRRFSGAGNPPAQLLWDGHLGGAQRLVVGHQYAAQLTLISTDGAGGASPIRTFAVKAPPLAPSATKPQLHLDGRARNIGANGRFALVVGRPHKKALLVELSRGDGARAWTSFGPTPTFDDDDPPERLKITGDLESARLVLAGKVIDTSLLRVDIGPAPSGKQGARTARQQLIALDRRGAPKAPVSIEARCPSSLVQQWRLRIRDGKGKLVRTLRGLAPLPRTIAWDGNDARGAPALRPGERYEARLTLVDIRGNMGQSPPLTLRVSSGRALSPLKLQARRLFDRRTGALRAPTRARLRAALRRLRQRPASERYQLEAGVAPPATADSTRWASMLRRANEELAKELQRHPIEAERVLLLVNAVPLPPSLKAPSRKSRRVIDRRRESLSLVALPPKAAPRIIGKALVRVDGKELPLIKGRHFDTRASIQLGAAAVIELRDRAGHRAVLLVPTAASHAGPSSKRPLRSLSASRVAAAGPSEAGAELLRMRGGASLSLRLAQAPSSRAASAPVSPTSAPASQPRAKAPPDLSAFGRSVLSEQLGATGPAAAPAPPKHPEKVYAADLRVDLPPRGAILRSTTLTLRGHTHAKNVVTINAQKVRVLEDGSFTHRVALKAGKSELIIRAKDHAGNVGEIRWPVQVSDSQLFLMALAEGAIGQPGVELPEDNAHSRLDSDALLLRGRAVLYLKARIKGKYLFKRYFVTAHLDTAKRREFEEFFDQVIDPNRYYPIYGDSAEQVRDVNARDKLYVLVRADDSTLRVGNFRSEIKGLSLLRYDRALYGAKVDLRRAFAKKRLRSRLQAFYSRDDARLARDINLLRATGGSIYYLRHGRVMEGSERVRLVIRERDTGLELGSMVMTRDHDYRIDYAGGRLLFSAPISSVADPGFLAANPALTAATLAGHPVYVEVGYQYEADEKQNDSAWGVQGESTLFDVLSLGGTYVSEQRAGGLGGDYRLYGAHLSFKHGKGTQLEAEFARSESFNVYNHLSEDGGITYLAMNTVSQQSADARAGDSNAYALRGSLELSDFIKRVKARSVQLHGYYDRKERGFFSGGTILDQGRTRYGGRLEWQLSDYQTITARHDGAVALLPQLPTLGASNLDPLMMREVEQELSRLRYELRHRRWRLAAEYAHLYSADPTTTGFESFRHTLGAKLAYRVNPWLSVSLGQDGIAYASGADPQLGTGVQLGLQPLGSADWRDRLLTTLGTEIRLKRWLSLQATGALRWSGDTSASLGLKTTISKTAATYLRQVVGSIDGRFNTVTVVGAEDRFGPKLGGRTYGEYQLDSGAHGRRNRAILGLTHKWTPWRGISFNGGFEHQQIFGARQPDGTPLGDAQRDVVHVGFELLKPRKLKLSTRAELRYDGSSGVSGLGVGGFSPQYNAKDGLGAVNAPNVDPRAGFGPGNYADRSINPAAQLITTPGERWQVVTRAALAYSPWRALTLFGRANFARTYNTTESLLEAEALELSFGAALRPITIDWIDVLFKYTRLQEMRPISLTDHLAQRRTYDIVSLVPIIELPWRLQLVEKIAYKRVEEQLDLLPGESITTTLHTLLWINRLNLHITGRLDAGVEYRLMRLFIEGQGDQLLHGTLVEAGYWLHRMVRLGIGYNFTRFSDNQFAEQNRDAKGFFFRVVGRY